MPTRSPVGSESGPCSRVLLGGGWWRSSSRPEARARKRSARAAPPAGSRPMTRTVSSPAMVPRTLGSTDWSRAEARNCAAPGGVRRTTRLALDSALTSRSSQVGPAGLEVLGVHRRVRRAVAAERRHRVDQAVVGGPNLARAELDEVARQGGLGDCDALGGQQGGQLGLGADGVVAQQLDDAGVPGGLGGGGRHGSPVDLRSNHTISAFWACRRFSASSQTTRLRTVDDVGGDLLPAVGRQAVQHDRVGGGPGQAAASTAYGANGLAVPGGRPSRARGPSTPRCRWPAVGALGPAAGSSVTSTDPPVARRPARRRRPRPGPAGASRACRPGRACRPSRRRAGRSAPCCWRRRRGTSA